MPPSSLRRDLEPGADEHRPLAHPADAAGVVQRRLAHAASVVADRERGAAVAPGERTTTAVASAWRTTFVRLSWAVR